MWHRAAAVDQQLITKTNLLKINQYFARFISKTFHFHTLHDKHVYVLEQWNYKRQEIHVKSTKKICQQRRQEVNIFMQPQPWTPLSVFQKGAPDDCQEITAAACKQKQKTGEMLRFYIWEVFGLRYPHNTHNWMCFHFYLGLSFISPLYRCRFHTGSRRARWSSGWHRESPPGCSWPEAWQTVRCWTAQCS